MSFNPQTLLERLQLKSMSPFPPRSTTASSWSQSPENSPPRTVRFLDQTPLTTEQEFLSSRHQAALKEAHRQGKTLRSRTSLPLTARSLDSISTNSPLPQLSFGSLAPVAGSSEVFIAKDVYRDQFATSTPQDPSHPDPSKPNPMSLALPFPALRAGLEQGYEQSPMSRLKSDFLEEHEQASSTHT